MIIPNALITVNHLSGTVDSNIQVSIQPAPPERIVSLGGVIAYDIHIPCNIPMRQGDVITVISLYGHPYNQEVKTATAGNPVRIAGLIPYISVEVKGVYL